MIVQLDGRKFIVTLDDAGVSTIREELVYEAGRPWEALYRVTRWDRKRNASGRPGSLYARVQEAALEAA